MFHATKSSITNVLIKSKANVVKKKKFGAEQNWSRLSVDLGLGLNRVVAVMRSNEAVKLKKIM